MSTVYLHILYTAFYYIYVKIDYNETLVRRGQNTCHVDGSILHKFSSTILVKNTLATNLLNLLIGHQHVQLFVIQISS